MLQFDLLVAVFLLFFRAQYWIDVRSMLSAPVVQAFLCLLEQFHESPLLKVLLRHLEFPCRRYVFIALPCKAVLIYELIQVDLEDARPLKFTAIFDQKYVLIELYTHLSAI